MRPRVRAVAKERAPAAAAAPSIRASSDPYSWRTPRSAALGIRLDLCSLLTFSNPTSRQTRIYFNTLLFEFCSIIRHLRGICDANFTVNGNIYDVIFNV